MASQRERAEKAWKEWTYAPFDPRSEPKVMADYATSELMAERERQIGYLSKLCWTAGDIYYALIWGVDESEHELIAQQIANSKWPMCRSLAEEK